MKAEVFLFDGECSLLHQNGKKKKKNLIMEKG
jgi:hypothetical protein